MLEGLVIRGYSSFYYVEIDGQVWECRLRGRFKMKGEDVLAGDRVKVKPQGHLKGVIEEILPRKTKLIRPLVANVDQAVIVFACADPDPQIDLLNRMLIQAEHFALDICLCFNKADLISEKQFKDMAAPFLAAGYKVIKTSTFLGEGIEELKSYLQGRITVFAGPSGVGKSSLLNALNIHFQLKTGEVSQKIGRGRHTTRYAELLPISADTMVVDSPGFSTLIVPDMEKNQLAYLFPEFKEYLGRCRFNGCLHNSEPDCGIKEAVQEGLIHQGRYDQYLTFLEELQRREGRYS